jgi:riboflavin kinase / FMN adenylyltransferase
MSIFFSLDEVQLAHPQVVTIGVFDGVHQGHRYLLEHTAALAEQQGAEVTVITFWPPPQVVLRPEKAVSCLSLRDEKVALLANLPQVQHVIVMPFTAELAQLQAVEYMVLLRQHLPLLGIVEGEDFTLGHNREGTISWLQTYGAAEGIAIMAVPRKTENSTPISSTRIRTLISVGDVAEAAALLERPYMITGKVIHGDGRGRLLGYPTANMQIDPSKLIPADGVYAARAWRTSVPNEAWQSAVSIGTRPVFQGIDRRVEAYLLDVDLPLYDMDLTIALTDRIRGEENFPSVEALIEQMGQDVAKVRYLLANHAARDQQIAGQETRTSV